MANRILFSGEEENRGVNRLDGISALLRVHPDRASVGTCRQRYSCVQAFSWTDSRNRLARWELAEKAPRSSIFASKGRWIPSTLRPFDPSTLRDPETMEPRN